MVSNSSFVTVSPRLLEKQEAYPQRRFYQKSREAIGSGTVVMNGGLISIEEPVFFIGVAGGFKCYL